MDKRLQTQIGLLWAKSNKDCPKEIHLLIFHLLESAAVASSLWNFALSESLKKDIAGLLKMPLDQVGRMLAYWIGLHDIGKASPAFQSLIEQKNPALIEKIRESGLSIERETGFAYHSQLGGKFIREKHLAPPEVDIAVSGHHGVWNSAYVNISTHAYGSQSWDDVRNSLCDLLKECLDIEPVFSLGLSGLKKNIFITWFSGFICVSDWIASNESFFTYNSNFEAEKLVSYFSKACEKARQSLIDLGYIGWHTNRDDLTFQQMFPTYSPRDIQQQVFDLFNTYKPDKPFLMIVEAPTGIGKTEIAMYLSDHWLQKMDGSGMYIAMPTQATSNQLYTRTLKVLSNRYPGQKVNVVLAHGQACWNKDLEKIRVSSIGDMQKEQSLLAAEWFQDNRKRTLLAPFGVGTVDQVFLSILQTKHFFVRLFGLKNKVIVFDEVHAYDTYMNELFYRLLEWLRGLGTSVIILSATLPEKTCQKIVASYCGEESEHVHLASGYPRVTLGCPPRAIEAESLPWSGIDRQININWIKKENISELIKERLSSGGCAAIICNTVRHAQQVYLELKEQHIVDAENLILFHARFPFEWRNKIEEKVLKKFEKESTAENGLRPSKAIVVATQVIEQSLDLDFDFMVTELAPVDLILQRAGRLHRHDRKNTRPQKLKKTELVLIDVGIDDNGIPVVGEDEPFYDKSILLKTYLELKEHHDLKIISSTRSLIEKVYSNNIQEGEYSEQIISILNEWQQKEKKEQEITGDKAHETIVRSPEDQRLVFAVQHQLIDNENGGRLVYEHLRAKTRDGGISIRLPCLFTNASGKYFVDLQCTQELTQADLFRQLSLNEIGISSPYLVKTIYEEAEDLKDKFQEIRSKKILVFHNGKRDLGNFHLEISPELGLIYEYGGKNAKV